MKTHRLFQYFVVLCLFVSCITEQKTNESEFKYLTEQFSDLKIIRYKVPGFENLELKQSLPKYLYSSKKEIIFTKRPIFRDGIHFYNYYTSKHLSYL